MNVQPDSRNAIHIDLAAETLLHFSEVRFVARGSSMLPSIFPGDCLTIKTFVADAPQVDDIVLVRRNNDFLVHRVVRILTDQPQQMYLLRGDALTQDDPPILRCEILGRVTSLVRAGKSLPIPENITVSQRALRSLVRNSSVATALLLRWNATRSRRSLREYSSPTTSGNPHQECN
jgi:hypothetical protein